MVRTFPRLGNKAVPYVLIAAMSVLLAGCGGSSGETELPIDQDTGEDGFDIDDVDGTDDLDEVGDDVADGVIQVSDAHPCGGEEGSDNMSATPEWNDNCEVKRSLKGGQFADSLFAVGIQRVLYCSGYGAGNSYIDFAEGEYGELSEAAAMDFQRDESLAIDGIVGEQTWARLQEKLELLEEGVPGENPDVLGFTTGRCAGIPMFYQTVTADSLLGGWTLARNRPNEAEEVAFSYEKPFNKL